MPAQVPGTVLNSYVKNGRFPEPYYGVNNKLSRDEQKNLTKGLIPDASVPGSVFIFPHWFRTTFTLTPEYKGRLIWLNLNGINWKAEIFLNGRPVGEMQGAFKRGIFHVTDKAVLGKNIVAVRVHPLLNPGIPHDSGCGGDRLIGNTPATMHQTVGWDFTCVDGIRDRNIGIHRDVYITSTGPVAVRDPFMSTEGVPDDTAKLNFRTYLVNATNALQQGVLTIETDGVTISKDVTLAANEEREETLSHRDFPKLVISRPRLWWPAGRGKPELYPLRVSFRTAAGVSDALTTTFGIRSVVSEPMQGQHVFKVNGRRMFMCGGNWVQDAMQRSTRERYDAQLRMITQSGLNWLRMWSGSGQEHDDFFELCDKYGVLVWVEAGLTVQTKIPKDETLGAFKQCFFENWKDTILRVRNHPSVFHYAGCNEGGDITGMAAIVAQYDGTRDYQPNSQQFGQRGAPYRFLPINTLYDYTGIDLFGAGPKGIFGGFCNETGNPCLPAVECLREQMPEEKLWPIDDEYFQYQDGGGFHQMTEFVKTGCADYGDFAKPDLAGRTGVENYAFKGQLVGAMQYRADAELWQRNKWDETGKFATGYALWTANNTHPQLCSRIYHYSLEPNASLYYLAHGNKAWHVQYDYFANDVSVVNNSFVPAAKLRVKAEVRNLDWSLQWSGGQAVESLPEEQTIKALFQVPPKDTPGFDDVHLIYVQLLDSAGTRIDDMIYWRSKGDPKYGAERFFYSLNRMPVATLQMAAATRSEGAKQIITVTAMNPSKSLAFFNRLKICRGASKQLVRPVFYSDNYFSILPGQTKTVTIDFDAKELDGEVATIVAEGWNLPKMEVCL